MKKLSGWSVAFVLGMLTAIAIDVIDRAMYEPPVSERPVRMQRWA